MSGVQKEPAGQVTPKSDIPIGRQVHSILMARLMLQFEAEALDDHDPRKAELLRDIEALDAAVRTVKDTTTEPIALSEKSTCPECGKPFIENWVYVGDHSHCIPF